MVYIFIALVLLIVTSFVIYRNTLVIEQYSGYRQFSFIWNKQKKRNKSHSNVASKVAAAFTNANYFDFTWNYDHHRQFYQRQYPDLGQNKRIGSLTHDSPLPDEGGNSWFVYGTRVYDYIKRSETEYDFNVFWRNLYIIPTNEIYRGSLFKYGTGPENNRIPINTDSLDMNIDLGFLKTVPSLMRFRHFALHTTPYTFTSFEK